MRFRLLTLLTLAVSASFASADLYTQGPVPGGEGGAFSDVNQIMADNFVTGSSASVTGITFWGSFFLAGNPFPSGGSRNVLARFYDNNGGQPGLLLGSQTISTTFAATGGLSGSGDEVYKFDWSGPAFFSATAGTQYWLSIMDTEGTNSFRWHNGLNGDGNAAFSTDGTNSWSFSGGDRGDMAFVLNPTVVPEPASMIALGLGAAAVLRRRKRA